MRDFVVYIIAVGMIFVGVLSHHQKKSVNDLKAIVAEQKAEIADLKARTSTHVKTKIQDRHPDMNAKEN